MTEFEQMVAGVTDEQAGLSTMTPAEKLAKHIDNVKRCLDRLLTLADDLERVERVMGANLPEVCRDAPLGDAVDLMADIHMVVARLTNDSSGGGAIEKVKARLKYVKEVTMPERFTEEKINSFTTERFRVTKSQRVFASILGGQQEAAYAWLEDNDLGGLVKPTVNSSALSAAAKEIMENGRELPDDLFRAHYQMGTSVTAKRKG